VEEGRKTLEGGTVLDVYPSENSLLRHLADGLSNFVAVELGDFRDAVDVADQVVRSAK
jgi:hypothetical protein